MSDPTFDAVMDRVAHNKCVNEWLDSFDDRSIEHRSKLCAYFAELDLNRVTVTFNGVEEDQCNCQTTTWPNNPIRVDSRTMSDTYRKALRIAEEMLMRYVWQDTCIQSNPYERGRAEWFMGDNTIDIYVDGFSCEIIYGSQEGPDDE